MPPAELATSLTSTEAERLMQAEAAVRDYCGWHIAPEREDITVTVDGTGTPVLLVPSMYVTAVTEVVDDGTTIEDTLYTWRQNGTIELHSGHWGCRKVDVTMTHGYGVVPAAVTAIVQQVAQRAVSNPRSLVRKQVGPFADTFSQTGFNQSLPIALIDAEKLILDRYKIPGRP